MKVVTLSEAISLIHSGDKVGISGFPGVSETRAVSCPVNALMREDLPLFRLPKKAI